MLVPENHERASIGHTIIWQQARMMDKVKVAKDKAAAIGLTSRLLQQLNKRILSVSQTFLSQPHYLWICSYSSPCSPIIRLEYYSG